MKKHFAIQGVLYSILIIIALSLTSLVQATPYASCITNNSGTISFYLNEGGGNVTITYDDGSTNANFNGITAGTNLAAGVYNFSLGVHNSYSIAVNKVGNGATSVIRTSPSIGNLRGIDVNKQSTSPYFGHVYFVRSNPGGMFEMNSDFSMIVSNTTAGVSWVSGDSSSPYRIAVAPDDYIMVGDFSSTGAAVWRITPDLTANQLFLGPVGDTAGQTAGVHGKEYSRPLLIGSPDDPEGATMFIVDGTFPADAPPYSILVYSNIITSALPWENPPDLIGPEDGVNYPGLNNVFPGLTRGPNGYFYASNYRNNFANPVLTVYDTTGTNELWNSLAGPVLTGPDYFVDSGGQGLADSAVSPDGRYLVGLHAENRLTVCALTNGIPDVSTLYTIVNPAGSTIYARGVAWDAADNIYVTSSGIGAAQEWTMGFTATAVTTGDATGTTGFALQFPATTVSITTTNSLISQENSYGNPTNTSFTITRTGDTSGSLNVAFGVSGTAPGSTYTIGAPTTISLAAGQISTNIPVAALADGIARPTTSLTVTLSHSPTYSVGNPATVTFTILNTAPDEIIPSVGAPTMYNAFGNDYASVILTRWGDTNADAFTVSSFTTSGSAVQGTDYTAPTSATFNPGDLTQTVYIHPLNNGLTPTHSLNLPYTGNKTVTIGVNNGASYTAATNTATLTIIDSANPPATVLFEDALTNADGATNWNVTAANGDMPNSPVDYTINFGYDLLNADIYQPIPLPPNGAATALRVTCNKNNLGNAPSTGVNLYLTNIPFSGDFAVRFNMNIVEGDSPLNTTEGPLFGIDHNGTETNWWTGSGLYAGADPSEWASDGIWYWVSADGGAALGDYVVFSGNGGALPNTGWELLARLYRYNAPYNTAFKTNVFTSDGGPGLAANGSVESGYDVSSWSDVEIKQIGDVVTLSIDKTPIYSYVNTTTFTNGVLMLGYEDPFDASGGPDGAVYYSNLRVVRLTPPSLSQAALNTGNNTVVIDFTSVDGSATTSSFVVQSASNVAGPYSDVPGATITQLPTGAFQAVVPMNGSMQFYRLRLQ